MAQRFFSRNSTWILPDSNLLHSTGGRNGPALDDILMREWEGRGGDDGRPHINRGSGVHGRYYTLAQRATVHSHGHTYDTSTPAPFTCALWRSFWESRQNLHICMSTHAGSSRRASTSGWLEWGSGIWAARGCRTVVCVRLLGPMWLNPWLGTPADIFSSNISSFCYCGFFFFFSPP